MDERTLTGLELRSTVTADGRLRVALREATVPEPAPGEVVVRVEAAPVNPSDVWLLLGPADLSTLAGHEEDGRPVLTAAVPAGAMGAMRARLDRPLAVGNEGAGTVVRAGAGAEHLLGRRVGMFGGAMFAQLRRIAAERVMPLLDGASAADGAGMWVNPLTALAIVGTLRREGHTALVHTAAASNLGQMLVRVCAADGVGLVCVVRSPAQAATLRAIGAEWTVDSTSPAFERELADAVAATGATLAFDAVGGGTLANAILRAMEAAAGRGGEGYAPYGSGVTKQVYVYGGLDRGPTVLDRSYGMAWSVGGFLLTTYLARAGADEAAAMRTRVARELTTTFASAYDSVVSLADVLRPDVAAAYAARATGGKVLVDPTRPAAPGG